MGISDISGRLASIIATTPRLTTLESVLQASLSVTHAPVSSRAPKVEKLGESSVSRQAIDSPNQPVLKAPHDAHDLNLRNSEPVLTHLSKTAGFLNSLLPPRENGSQPRAAIPAATQPVIDEPPTYPAPLAIALQSNLQESGLFYESHLLSWYQGQYPREQLMKEPQSQLVNQPRPDSAPEKSPANPAGASSLFEPPAGKQDVLQPVRPETIANLDNDQPGRPESTSSSGSVLKDPASMPVPGKDQAAQTTPANDAARLITQQLLLLDKPSLEWSVNVWPGQTATLLIEEETARTAEAQASWSSTIQLDFPKLGHMEISLKMDAHGLRVHLDTENEKAFSSLIQQRQLCAEKLASTGCKLREFSIGGGHANA